MFNLEQLKFSDELSNIGCQCCFSIVPKEFLSGFVVIAQILVWSNEDLNAACKVLFPFINSAI